MASDGSKRQIGKDRQSQIFVPGLAGHRPAVPTDSRRLEAHAREVLSPESFGYLAGGAGNETTIRANRAAFEQWRIVPRVLRDVSRRDASLTLFGDRLPCPVLLAPIGVLELAHRDADIAVAKAAAAEGVPMIYSNQASVPMEECANVMGDSPRWFQLYWSQSSALMRSFVKRAENSGCSAIVLSVDTTLLGWRPRDLDLAYLPFLRGYGIAQYTSDPVFRASLSEPLEEESLASPGTPNWSLLKSAKELFTHYPESVAKSLLSGEPLKAVQRFIATYSRPSLTWDDLSELRRSTRLPIVIKGILHADDAREAVARGASGIIVSNHGGRQIDGAIAALDALPAVVEAVGGEIPILLDSGIRGGADVLKALALGATAVCLGRPYAYGLAIAGEVGVREVIQNIRADFDLTLGLAGLNTLQDVNRECIARPDHP